MHLRHIAGRPCRHAACGRLEHKNSDLQALREATSCHGSAAHVTLFTALAIVGRMADFGLESVLWLTDQNGLDA